jgi:hypothetical protein
MGAIIIPEDLCLTGACHHRGNVKIATYDQGWGKVYIMRNSMGIQGITRCICWEDAWEICEDEFFPEADETVKEIEKDHRTIYKSGRELWLHERKNVKDAWKKFQKLSESEKAAIYARRGKDVKWHAHFSEHPCFQEAYGFRPNGPNKRDKHGHGIYAKDLNGESLEVLTEELAAELGIILCIEPWEGMEEYLKK